MRRPREFRGRRARRLRGLAPLVPRHLSETSAPAPGTAGPCPAPPLTWLGPALRGARPWPAPADLRRGTKDPLLSGGCELHVMAAGQPLPALPP